MDFSSLTEKDIKQRYDSLPNKLKEASDSEALKGIVYSICTDHNLHDQEKILMLEQLTGLIILGFVSSEDLRGEIIEHLELDHKTSTLIAQEIDKKIFSHYRPELEKVYSPLDKLYEQNKEVKMEESMSCKYHPVSGVAGVCRCGSEFCSECAFPFIEGKKTYHLCLDCAAKFANKRLIQSYVAAAIGFIVGLFMIKELGFLVLIMAPVYAYIFWGTFFGWFYGGRIWQWLAESDKKHGWLEKYWWMGFILFGLRVTVAVWAGILGGGIMQFLRYRNIVKKMEQINTALAA